MIKVCLSDVLVCLSMEANIRDMVKAMFSLAQIRASSVYCIMDCMGLKCDETATQVSVTEKVALQ